MCLTPIKIKAKKKEDGMIRQQGSVIVPCGGCPACKQKRADQWAFRLEKESKYHNEKLFITLTYDNANIRRTQKGFKTLNKRDLQLFFKRLRRNKERKNDQRAVVYYAAAEYGTTTFRPHYHAVLFGCDTAEIERAWTLGSVWFGQVEQASICYTTKYICKDQQIPMHANDDRLPEFSLMSKGIGKRYITSAMLKWHKDNKANYVVQLGGYKSTLPRYLKNFIFSEEEKQWIMHQCQVKHKQAYEKDIRDAGGTIPYYRNRFESIQAALHNARQAEKTKRNKV